MYFTFECPHCQKKLKVQEELAGRKVGCPYCKHSMVVPASRPVLESTDGTDAFRGIGEKSKAPAPDRPSPSQQPSETRREQPGQQPPESSKPPQRSSSGGSWSDRTDVSILNSGLIGLGLAVAFLLVMLPFKGFYLGELFWERGWVPFVLVFFLGWSVAILYLKSKKIKLQKASMLFDLLPNELSEDINEESLDKFALHIQELPVEPGESFLVNRVMRGLEHFRVRKSNPEVAEILASQSEIDANAVQSSYTLLNTFIWAIPILGFIGTVIGIGTAVGSFAGGMDAAEGVAEIKESLSGVTGGLATAFDTTLVALVMSMLVMFPSSSMQKAEEDLLNSVDEYCNENLLKRLDDGQTGVQLGGATDTAVIRQALNAELTAWSKKLEAIGSTISDRVVESWDRIDERVRLEQVENVEQIKDVDSIVAAFGRTMTQLAKRSDAVHNQAAGSMKQSAESLTAYLAALEKGLSGLNGVLEKLGERQVVIAPEPRRGWFFRKRDR